MNRKYICISTLSVLFICVWLGARKRNNEQANARATSQARAESGYFDTFGVIDDVDIDSASPPNAAFGACTDNPQFIADCEAPFIEPGSPIQPEAVPPETICPATFDTARIPAIADAALADVAPVSTTVRPEPIMMASTFGKRCSEMNATTGLATNSDPGAPSDATVCSCGMKQCLCG